MGADTLTEILGKYGIGAMVVVVLCIISYAIIKHILKQSDKILESAMQANEKWQKVIDEHTSQAREFHNTQTEAIDMSGKNTIKCPTALIK